MDKYFYYIKAFATAAIMFFALGYERTVGPRFQYFIYLAAAYIVVGLIRGLFINNLKLKFASYFFDIGIILAMEFLTRYVINYSFHLFYIIVMIEAAREIKKRNFAIIASIAGVASFVKYMNMLLMSNTYTKVAETVFFSVSTLLIIVTLYLYITVKEEKTTTEMVYQELVKAYQSLESKQQIGSFNLEVEPLLDDLTEREREICGLIASGKNNKEISEALYLSEGTVKNHITNILRKLELRDRTQLAVFSLKHRI
jgi:DNA-binding CsgD family transcriptional regulator